VVTTAAATTAIAAAEADEHQGNGGPGIARAAVARSGEPAQAPVSLGGMTAQPGPTRLPLVWTPWLRPLGWLIGGVASRSWVEVGAEKVTASFGPLAWAEVPRAAISSAARVRWPWWRGYGVRWYDREAVGFVGWGRGVVELTLDSPIQVRAVLNRRVRRLALSPADPDRLLALLGGPADPEG